MEISLHICNLTSLPLTLYGETSCQQQRLVILIRLPISMQWYGLKTPTDIPISLVLLEWYQHWHGVFQLKNKDQIMRHLLMIYISFWPDQSDKLKWSGHSLPFKAKMYESFQQKKPFYMIFSNTFDHSCRRAYCILVSEVKKCFCTCKLGDCI